MQRLTDDAWKELCVDIECEGCLRVLGRCADSGHTVVFGVIACCDGEVLVEQLRVAGHAGHLGRRSLESTDINAVVTMRGVARAGAAWLSKVGRREK